MTKYIKNQIGLRGRSRIRKHCRRFPENEAKYMGDRLDFIGASPNFVRAHGALCFNH